MTLVEELIRKCISLIDNKFVKGECTKEQFEDYRTYMDGYDECKEKAIEVVKNYNPWIPASERPEDIRQVDLTLEDEFDKNYRITTIGKYSFKHNRFILLDKKISNRFKVIAWKERPEPYEGEIQNE